MTSKPFIEQSYAETHGNFSCARPMIVPILGFSREYDARCVSNSSEDSYQTCPVDQQRLALVSWYFQ